MANIWITYSWKDNENQDVDFIAQSLTQAGAITKLDRWQKRCAAELTVTGFLAAIIIYALAVGLYHAEHETQPEKFSSIPAAVWPTISTLTTVGYGDVVPIYGHGQSDRRDRHAYGRGNGGCADRSHCQPIN